MRCTATELSLLTEPCADPYFRNLSVPASHSTVFSFRFLQMVSDGNGIPLSFVIRRNGRDGFQIPQTDCYFKQLDIYPFAFTFETPIEDCCQVSSCGHRSLVYTAILLFRDDRGAVSPPTRVLPKIELEPRNTG